MTVKTITAAALAALLWAACGSEYPPPPQGGRISGALTYEGDALASMQRPVVRIYASEGFPPLGQPNATVIVNPPDIVAQLTGSGLPYEIMWLPPHTYKVAAQIVDLDDPHVDYSQLPLGGYPNYCSLLRPGEGLVVVTEDIPATGMDFAIFDEGGAGDRCTERKCPAPGESGIRVIVKSSVTPTASDMLRVAVFKTVPAAIPFPLLRFAGDDVTFPAVVMAPMPPGNYVVVDTCLDIGANSGEGRCTEEDFDAAYSEPFPPIEFPADRIVTLTADLDAGTVTVDGIGSPSDYGCP